MSLGQWHKLERMLLVKNDSKIQAEGPPRRLAKEGLGLQIGFLVQTIPCYTLSWITPLSSIFSLWKLIPD